MKSTGDEAKAQKSFYNLLTIHFVKFEQPQQGGCKTPSGTALFGHRSYGGRFRFDGVPGALLSIAVVDLDDADTFYVTMG